jgi:PPM family protein phosphatase
MLREVRVKASGKSDPGNARLNNEDAFMVADALTGSPVHETHAFDASDHPLLLALSDGMGGQNAGEIASDLTLASLRDVLVRRLPIDDASDALRTAVELANQAVTDAAAVRPTLKGMGATLVAILIVGNVAHLASIGDSRAYLLRGDTLVRLTKDQTFLQSLIDAGRIAGEDIARFPHKHMLVQAIGHAVDLAVPIARIELRRHDILVLASDGLTDELDNDRIRALASTGDVAHACRELVAAANECGGRDNITVIAASVTGEGVPELGPDDLQTPEATGAWPMTS